MDDTWSSRDLPVLKAVVDIYERTGRTTIRPGEIQDLVGLDKETVVRAVRALSTEPYFEEPSSSWTGQLLGVGKPNFKALRVAGQWPSPERLLERLVTALEDAGDDDSRQPEERSKFKQAAAWLGTAASQVAIGALGGAGGNIIS